MLNLGVSIIICTYNGSSRIKKTLQHLAGQNLHDNINCEIILIDNASTDNTTEIAQSIWKEAGNNKIAFSIRLEETPGVGYARKKGIAEAKYDFIIFCDDDNWLDANYAQNVFEIFHTNPTIGVLGGLGYAVFADPSKKPDWFDKFHHGYAVGTQANEEAIVNSVYGAGMAIRKSVAATSICNQFFFLHGRKQNSLSAGEDSEIYLRLRLSGYLVMYSPKLTFKHFLPSQRLSWTYVKNLYIGFAKTHVVLNLYEKALSDSTPKLSHFYWLKKGLYYWAIYIKYWPRQYLVYKNREGTIEEIHHITWRNIALSYLKYNFKTVKIYSTIFRLKKTKF